MKFNSGDHVHHAPSGEDWIVLRAGEDSEGSFVEPVGWPPCRARASDCTLIKRDDGTLARMRGEVARAV